MPTSWSPGSHRPRSHHTPSTWCTASPTPVRHWPVASRPSSDSARSCRARGSAFFSPDADMDRVTGVPEGPTSPLGTTQCPAQGDLVGRGWGHSRTPTQEGVLAMTTDLDHAPVVLASDGTPGSEGALRFAVQECGVRGAGLVIVHVNPMAVPVPPLRPILPIGPLPVTRPTPPSELSVHARRVLDRAEREARELAPDLSVSTCLLDGRRVRAIVDAAADAQLVVVG